MANVESEVDEKIQSKKVMVFSKTTCPFCKMAKDIFAKLIQDGELSIEDYEVMEIEKRPDSSAIQDYLNKLTGARTVPRVFISGKCIGGGSEVAALHKNGNLVPRLKP